MRFGLKLWSTNTDYYLSEARRLFVGGWFDYMELCVVPGSTDTISLWHQLKADGVPFTLHAPHSALGINLADASMLEKNKTAYAEVATFAEALEPKYTVVHAGVNGNIEETLRQLNIIRPWNILIENKPYKTIYGDPICRGSSYEEVKAVLDGYKCGFCLDIGHAICAANSLSLEPYSFVKKFQTLEPKCYHLSDNFIDVEIDKHLHIGMGNYNFKRIFGIMDMSKDIAIETAKESKTDLDDFVGDIGSLRKI